MERISVNVVIIFQKRMVSGPNHDRNNNMLSCYQIRKLQRKGRGVIATKTIPGTIILSSPIQNPTQTQLSYPGNNIIKQLHIIIDKV